MISYVSQVAKSNSYVLPFDLNLMAKVLQFKETSFIQNAQKIQQGINSLSSLEMKDADGQKYLNGKINSLVTKVNDYGALDLSDMDINNQIDYMVNSLPQDETIITQVSGMKLGKKMAAEYEKFRTDPKMKGYYSDANYNWSMEQFNGWRMDGNKGSSYNGPTTATPFFDVNKFYHENLKNVRSQIAETITRPDGTSMYYMKDKNELIDEGQLKQIVNDLTFSDPRVSQQSQINSWYTAKGKTPEMIMGSLNESINYEINSTNGSIQYLKDQIELNPNDSNLRTKYGSQIKNLEAYNKSLKEKQTGYTIDNYNKNPEQFNFLDYQTRTARAFGNIYKVNKQTKELKLDNTWYLKESLALKRDANTIAMAKAGLGKDSKGNLILVNPQGQIDPSQIFTKSNTYDKDWTLEPDALLQTEDAIRRQIASINTEEAQVSVATIQQAIKENPNLEGVFTKELQDELTRRGSMLNPGDTQFDFDDLKYVNDLIKEGTFSKFIKAKDQRPIMQRVPQQNGLPGLPNYQQPLDPKDVEFSGTILNKMYDIWKTGASVDGVINGVDFKGLGLTQAFGSIQTLRRKRKMYDDTINKSFESAGLTQDEIVTYTDFLANPEKYSTGKSQSTGLESILMNPAINLPEGAPVYKSNIADIQNKLKSNTNYLNEISVRTQPTGWIMFDERQLGEKELAGKKVINSFKRQISNSIANGFFADESAGENIFKIGSKTGLAVKDENINDVIIYKTNELIEPTDGVIGGFNTRYYASVLLESKEGDKTSTKRVRVPIDSKVIHQELGNMFDLPEDQQLTNQEVRRFGSTNIVYDAGVDNFRVQFRVVSTGDDGISLYPKSKIQIIVKDKNSRTGNSYISVFGNKVFNTPAEAEREGRGIVDYYIKENSGKSLKLNDFINRLQNNL